MNDIRHHDFWHRLNTRVVLLGLAVSVAGSLAFGVRVGAQSAPPQQEADPALEYIAPTKPAFHFNRMIERLEQGYAVLGGVDYTGIDQKHSPFDLVGLGKQVADILNKKDEKGRPLRPPSVRIAPEGDQIESNSWVVQQVLETGVMGITVPGVATAAHARAIVQAVRFPQPKGSKYYLPLGRRGHGVAAFAGVRTWGLRFDEYVRRADIWPLNPDGDMMVIAMVETAEGIKNINEILDVPGISAVNIGPSDLSMDMTGRGYRSWWWPDNKNPADVEAAIQTVGKACTAKKKVCGVAVQTGRGREADQARAAQLITQGFRMVSAPRPGQPCTKKAPECY